MCQEKIVIWEIILLIRQTPQALSSMQPEPAAWRQKRQEETGRVLGPSPFATDLGRVTGSFFPRLVHWGLREEAMRGLCLPNPNLP